MQITLLLHGVSKNTHPLIRIRIRLYVSRFCMHLRVLLVALFHGMQLTLTKKYLTQTRSFGDVHVAFPWISRFFCHSFCEIYYTMRFAKHFEILLINKVKRNYHDDIVTNPEIYIYKYYNLFNRKFTSGHLDNVNSLTLNVNWDLF